MRFVQGTLASRTILQMDQATSADQAVFWHLRERSEVANMDRGVRLCTRSHRQKTTRTGGFTLHFATDIFVDTVRENTVRTSGYGYRIQNRTENSATRVTN